ncbi:unnamed protein product [Gongylonema pulchrum]|uniref:MFS domain-containing protein n=1 Tax=Gongylonema pulchrum TaxID=637853 RepID=A0A183CWU3_9BILA|nr:unnamed protein product [Gongylonema pulchrum]
MALSFVCLAYVPSNMVLLAEIAYVAAVAFSGLMWVGPVKSATLVSQQHAHFILAILSLINSLGILVLPVFVEAMAPDNTPHQWSIILLIICGIVIACTTMFAFVGEGEPAWWTKQEHHKNNNSQNRAHDMRTFS